MSQRLARLALIVSFAGCGSSGSDPDASVSPGVAIRRDGVALCVGEAVTAVDQVGQNRIDIEQTSCSTPVKSTFFAMSDGDQVPCVSLRVSNLGCNGGFMPTGSLSRTGTNASGSCTCHYVEIVPGGADIPHLIELTANVTLTPG